VLGGTQSLHTNSYDEALGLPTEESVRLALRTQQIIAHESGVASTADPLGGSYVVERLTDEIEARARDYLNTIDDLGGGLRAIQSGFIQHEIQDSAYRSQRALETGDRTVVGVNRYAEGDETKIELHRPDPAVERGQREAVEQLRRTRDQAKAGESLARLAEVAAGDENLLPSILACVEADVTLGEICDELRAQWGEYAPPAL
jgi:methylmalonyl-CoA mutase N-terminal domain/subunit